jgi:prophage tail gpP-like protein
MLNRDSEIRVQLFGVGVDISYLLTGIVDDIEFSEENRYTLTGRDVSSIAADTIADAGLWRQQRADEFIKKRVQELKMTSKFNMAKEIKHPVFRTDGSETEWEFWYRLIRHDSHWLWFSSDGTLNSGPLVSDKAAPSYFFGTPPQGDAHHWLPVERINYKKTTQTRIGEVEFFYHSGGRAESFKASDPTTKDWLKRPLKFIESKSIHTKQRAKKAVYEEIYESKMGALEIKVLIPDIGIIIKQNRIARLNVPEIDISSDWFIVGSRIVADDSGFMQEVRLREKGYAISKRIPDDPEVTKEPGSPPDITECLEATNIVPKHPEWWQYFVNSAHQWRSGIDFPLYLAVLLGICDVETGFTNERRLGGPGVNGIEYFKWEGKPQAGVGTKREWELSFANEASGGIVNEDFAVGPMQLYTASYKYDADRFDGGTVSELEGNRWLPEANIWIAGKVLQGKGATREENLWAAVRAYNGAGPQAEAYMNNVRNKVYNNPGYLKMVREALKACSDEGEFTGDADFPDDDAITAAKRLLAYKKKGWFDSNNSSVIDDIEKTAAGKQVNGPCGYKVSIKASPLNALLFLLDNDWSCMASSLCSSHPCQAKNVYNTIGDGVASTRSLIIQAMRMYKALTVGGGRPNQMICNGNGSTDALIQSLQLNNYEPDNYITGDHLDHIHIGY